MFLPDGGICKMERLMKYLHVVSLQVVMFFVKHVTWLLERGQGKNGLSLDIHWGNQIYTRAVIELVS